MSLQYLVDGYNVTRQIPAFERKKLKGERESLLRLIEAHRPQGSSRNKVTVVFDGQPDIYFASPAHGIQVVFSRGESADEKIRRLIGASAQKKNIIVVTDDKELKFSVRALGAKVLAVGEFLKKIHIISATEKRAKPLKTQANDEKQISKTLEYSITAELENIWLERCASKKQN